MFGFISKFKQEVVAGFDSIHQRIVTLEAKVEALFEHTKTVAAQDAAKAAAVVETPVVDAAKEVEAAAPVAETVATDVKNV